MAKVQVSIDMDKDLKEKIEKAAAKLYLSVAAFVRLACIEYANRVQETEIDETQIRSDQNSEGRSQVPEQEGS